MSGDNAKLGRRLYGCGFNAFGQLPLADQALQNLRQVTWPRRCIYCPKTIATYFALGWSRCVSKHTDEEFVSHGFSSVNIDVKREVIRSTSGTKAIHCFNGVLVAIPSSSSGLLMQKHPNQLEKIGVRKQDGNGDVWVSQIDSDEKALFALTEDQHVGKLDKDSEETYIYRPLFTEHRVKSLSCGKEHTLILTDKGGVFSVGSGSRGQLGHGTVEDRLLTPSLIEGLAVVPVINISAGGWHSAAVSEHGDLYMWGWNESGQLGYPMVEKRSTESNTPRQQQLSGDSSESQTRLKETEEPDRGKSSIQIQMNDDLTRPVTFLMTPQLLDMAPPKEVLIQSVSCGSRHTAAVTRDGHLYTWGYGRWGQLGHGNEWTLDTPTRVELLRGCVVEVYCREWNTFILTREEVT